ncbi:hypothetical protein [Kitasatospora sp. NPDC001547]|uniref:hypothetical protein n=1 Tax=Kitasatospora sp. NPDC001547 TaxID=3364015 RepID=UPI0036790DA7
MPARVRTKRRSSLPAIRISRLRPSTYNLRVGEVRTIVCPDCQTWQRIMGDTTLTIRDHHATDLGGAELAAGQQDRRCPSARRIVLVDLTAHEIAKWQKAQDRRIKPDAMPTETRRAARQHYKPQAPVAPAVHQLDLVPVTAGNARRRYEAHLQGCAVCTGLGAYCTDGALLAADRFRLRSPEPEQRQAASAPTAAERAVQWSEVLTAVQHTDMVRRTAVLAGYAEPRHLVYGAHAPTETLHPAAA